MLLLSKKVIKEKLSIIIYASMNTQRKTHMKVDFHSFFGNKKMTGASFYLYLST